MTHPDEHESLWLAYLIPGTDVLRNRLGLTDHNDLRSAEADLVEVRMAELRAAPDLVPRTYDLAHLRALHRHLFQDIYEWAGNIRQVGIAKGGESFAPPSNIQQPVSHVAQRLRGNDLLRTLDGPALAREVAYTYDYLNYAHPFREGNGRTQREFFDLLLAETHRGIAWDLVDSSMLHHACHQARAESDLTELETMFSRILDNSPGYDLDPG